ncbi:MAG TPA: M48 family metallopeptidase [Pyrinomonadaceae bacterium]|nr:M48 family metallopeptidase [Pyrinomonadaceae bacterium]
MNRVAFGKKFVSVAMIWALTVLPIASQTAIKLPKNKYKVEEDVKLGQQANRQVREQFPLLNDANAERYVEAVGKRLVAAIPPEFNQPAFNYQFDVVNASDINAFALPGGPMYVNRGMIEAAKNEGEMAGVMAHEISHVALRHATAQQTKMNNPLNQILGIGAQIGGGIVGGAAGQQMGAMLAQGYFLKYSRDYETQADILGSKIMAQAGYDPRDLANMFQTIQQQSKGGGPEWLSSHPDPGNRYQKINAEAGLLTVNGTPRKVTPEFRRIQESFHRLRPAKSMAEIAKDYERGVRPNNPSQSGGVSNSGNGGATNAMAGGRYLPNVEYPSTRMKAYTNSALSAQVPQNWKEIPTDGAVWFAPEGAYGDDGITHGVMMGAKQGDGGSLSQTTSYYIDELLKANSYLQQSGQPQRTTVSGMQAILTRVAGESPVTGKIEVVTVITALLPSGNLFYVAAVAPESEMTRYNTTFRSFVNSIQVNK